MRFRNLLATGALLSALALPMSVQAATPFADVGPSTPHAAAIATLTGLGLLHGISPGHFAPAAEVTRAQWAAMLARLLPAGRSQRVIFTDVPTGAWYHGVIERVVSRGVMNGVGGGLFSPTSQVTSAQAILSLERVLGYAPFAQGAWPIAPVIVATEVVDQRGVPVLLDALSHITPTGHLNRGQAAQLLANALYAQPTSFSPLLDLRRLPKEPITELSQLVLGRSLAFKGGVPF